MYVYYAMARNLVYLIWARNEPIINILVGKIRLQFEFYIFIRTEGVAEFNKKYTARYCNIYVLF